MESPLNKTASEVRHRNPIKWSVGSRQVDQLNKYQSNWRSFRVCSVGSIIVNKSCSFFGLRCCVTRVVIIAELCYGLNVWVALQLNQEVDHKRLEVWTLEESLFNCSRRVVFQNSSPQEWHKTHEIELFLLSWTKWKTFPRCVALWIPKGGIWYRNSDLDIDRPVSFTLSVNREIISVIILQISSQRWEIFASLIVLSPQPSIEWQISIQENRLKSTRLTTILNHVTTQKLTDYHLSKVAQLLILRAHNTQLRWEM